MKREKEGKGREKWRTGEEKILKNVKINHV